MQLNTCVARPYNKDLRDLSRACHECILGISIIYTLQAYRKRYYPENNTIINKSISKCLSESIVSKITLTLWKGWYLVVVVC